MCTTPGFTAPPYHIKTPPYSPKYLPLSYCSTLLFSSLAVVDKATVKPKRSELHTGYLGELFQMRRISDSLKHRSKEVPVYITLGGDLADSANISKALSSQNSRNSFAYLIKYITGGFFKGLHLDWDHPGGRCGDPNDTANLQALVLNLNGTVELMLSVPPSPALVSLYNLSGIIHRLKLVIVKTHTIRQDNLLSCTGDRADAHAAFMAIRASVPESYRNKLAYTIQVGVDKFEPNSAVPAVTDLTSGHPGRTTYRRVCAQYPDVEAPVGVECRLGTFVEHGKEYQVAFAGPRELKARMRNSYADGMGSVPVVVYGLDLDDFLGRCSGGVMSPLVRAVATGGP
ncbi:uncharacterized protein LOC121047767 [Ixodes scapularis]|uniref:uncharacterized protein LOC121047767 n=1 Tax=Ixodes scapularis TaxID=6945 RepID=UPI001C3887DE|nr:uncharacterized protein LOC121047767 [Ixodes scapularis]